MSEEAPKRPETPIYNAGPVNPLLFKRSSISIPSLFDQMLLLGSSALPSLTTCEAMAPPTPLDLALFHSCERELYNHLVRRLGRDPERMKWVMALWLWFESIGHHNFIRHIKSYGDQIILCFVEEAEAALDRMAGVQNNSGNEIPLTNALMTSEPIDLGFFDFQKSFAVGGVARIYQNVCQIIFDDKLMEIVSRDVDHPANESVMSSGLIVRPFGKGSTEEGDRIGATVAAAQNDIAEPLIPPGPIAPVTAPGPIAPPPPEVTGSVLNPMARPWAPGTNSSTEDQRSIFLTFSRGFPLNREEITEFFNSLYGPCVEQVMTEKARPGRRPMYGRIVFNSASMIAAVLNGQRTAKYMIKGRHLWARMYVPRHS